MPLYLPQSTINSIKHYKIIHIACFLKFKPTILFFIW